MQKTVIHLFSIGHQWCCGYFGPTLAIETCKTITVMIWKIWTPKNKKTELRHDKTNKMACAPSKDRSAWAFAQSDQSSLSEWRKLGSLASHWAHSKDSDQTGRMPRLIGVFVGCTCHFVGFVMRWLNCCNYPKILKMQCYHTVMHPQGSSWLKILGRSDFSLQEK